MTAARSSGWRAQDAGRSARGSLDRLDWDRDGVDWPNREASFFIQAGGLRWHVQRMGEGPVLLLVHGTGSSTHSWRDLAPLLRDRFTVVAMDLPGHGFTESPPAEGHSLPAMAAAMAELLSCLNCRPALAVGHSAGAAILARMILDGAIAPKELVSLNGAFIPFRGVPGQLFAPLAKVLAACSLVPRFFAWNAKDPGVIDRLLRSTGSALNPRGAELYRRLARNPGHLGAALSMMANWDLGPLLRDLSGLGAPMTLVVGARDGTVAPSEAHRVRARLPAAEIEVLPGLGHLAHEERPGDVAALLLRQWRRRNAE